VQSHPGQSRGFRTSEWKIRVGAREAPHAPTQPPCPVFFQARPFKRRTCTKTRAVLNMRTALMLLLLAAGTNAAGFRAIISPLMTQADAKCSCVAQVGFLATISASNVQEVSELLNSARKPLYGVWVGAEDRATEGEFVWQDGSAAFDAPWYPGEPDSGRGTDEDCVSMGQWWATWGLPSWELYDSRCEAMLPFVCQIDSLEGNEMAMVTSREAINATVVEKKDDEEPLAVGAVVGIVLVHPAPT